MELARQVLQCARSWKWTVGLSMAFLNCILSSVGFTLQRKAHLMSETSETESVSEIKTDEESRRLAWAADMVSVIGMGLYILASVPDIIAYMLIPQAACVAVACFRLNLVTFLGHTVLEEEASPREVVGMLVCSIGTFFVLLFGPDSESRAAKQRAGVLFHHAFVYIYLVVACSILLLVVILVHLRCIVPKRRKVKAPPLEGQAAEEASQLRCAAQCLLPFAAGLAFSLEKVFNTEMGFIPWDDGDNTTWFGNPLWYIFASGVAVFGLLDFYLNMRGARKMPLQVFVPLAFAFSTGVLYLQSVVVFKEFAHLEFRQQVLSMSGALLTLVGALCIQPPRMCSRTDIVAPAPATASSTPSPKVVESETVEVTCGKAEMQPLMNAIP